MGKSRLSSHLTYVNKFFFPFVFILASPSWFVVGMKGQTLFLYVGIIWVGFTVYLSSWAAKIKFVTLTDESFFISNGFERIEVPVKLLIEIKEYRSRQPPFVDLFFKDGTPFGSIVRIQPPGFFTRKRFDIVVSELKRLIRSN
jgi:hypothetical protein